MSPLKPYFDASMFNSFYASHRLCVCPPEVLVRVLKLPYVSDRYGEPMISALCVLVMLIGRFSAACDGINSARSCGCFQYSHETRHIPASAVPPRARLSTFDDALPPNCPRDESMAAQQPFTRVIMQWVDAHMLPVAVKGFAMLDVGSMLARCWLDDGIGPCRPAQRSKTLPASIGRAGRALLPLFFNSSMCMLARGGSGVKRGAGAVDKCHEAYVSLL
jgi:hypothetical protein